MISVNEYQLLLEGKPSLKHYEGLDTRASSLLGRHSSFDLIEKSINGVTISKSILSGRISDTVLASCIFSDIDFVGFFWGAQFTKSSILNSRFSKFSITESRFEECHLEALTFESTRFREHGMEKAELSLCGLDNINFKNMYFVNCRFLSCQFNSVHFDNCYLKRVTFGEILGDKPKFLNCEMLAVNGI